MIMKTKKQCTCQNCELTKYGGYMPHNELPEPPAQTARSVTGNTPKPVGPDNAIVREPPEPLATYIALCVLGVFALGFVFGVFATSGIYQ
jgi:hypothetical protein